MFYHISSLCPRTDIDMAQHGFAIHFAAGWRDLVTKSGITQEMINRQIETCGKYWLEACGFTGFYDPDDQRSPFERYEKPMPPGPHASPLYKPREAILVSWGEWGPEHISVPGNACGLDRGLGHCFNPFGMGGLSLVPHNIDSWQQKQLLLIVFTEIAESVILLRKSA